MVSDNNKKVARDDVWLVDLNPTLGSEVRKTRPCLIVSPNALNKWIRTVIILPLTSSNKPYVSRIPISFDNVSGQAMADQVRTVDKSRLIKRIGKITPNEAELVSGTLVEMFTR